MLIGRFDLSVAIGATRISTNQRSVSSHVAIRADRRRDVATTVVDMAAPAESGRKSSSVRQLARRRRAADTLREHLPAEADRQAALSTSHRRADHRTDSAGLLQLDWKKNRLVLLIVVSVGLQIIFASPEMITARIV